MAIEKMPATPLPRGSRPPASKPYRVKDGDNWWSVATSAGMDVDDLIEFNFSTRNPAEVNWYLRNHVGCVLQTPDGKNYCFSSSASPGIIYLPTAPKPPVPKPVSPSAPSKSYPYEIRGRKSTDWQRSIDRLTTPTHLVPIRIYADSFIPWEWVMVPDYPLVLVPLPIYNLIGTLGFGFYVHGDKRLEQMDYRKVRNRYRTRGVVEVNLLESDDEEYIYTANNQWSKSQFRLEDNLIVGERVLAELTGIDRLSSDISVTRLGPDEVTIKVSTSAAVPAHVAGPQRPIDFSYIVAVWCDTEVGVVTYTIMAKHDGFPAHECFIDCHGKIRKRWSYHPDWFHEIHTGTARPGVTESVNGSRALAGDFKHQSFTRKGSFAVW